MSRGSLVVFTGRTHKKPDFGACNGNIERASHRSRGPVRAHMSSSSEKPDSEGSGGEDWRWIGMGLEEDCKRIGGVEEDWRRIGGGLEEDWSRSKEYSRRFS